MRQQFVKTENLEEAEDKCPWACAIIDVYGGYRAFESIDDYENWSKASDMCYVRAVIRPDVNQQCAESQEEQCNDALYSTGPFFEVEDAKTMLDSNSDVDDDWEEWVYLELCFPENLIPHPAQNAVD